MMNPVISAAAREWVIRAQHPEFEDWDGLSAWMADDVRHADEFNRLSLLDQDIAETVATAPPAQRGKVIALTPPRPARWHGWAIAASLAVLAVPTSLWVLRGTSTSPAASEVAIRTRPGETRTVTLADGTNIALAGGSSLAIDEATRRVAMAAGLATFSVKHDAAHPLTVTLGEVTVTDVGTVFEIRRRSGETLIGVGQGEVRVDGRDTPSTRVVAGQQLHMSAQSKPALSAMSDDAVGQWRRGVLEYDGARIADVAADIQNLTGTPVTAAPAVANQRFAGTIAVTGDPGHALQRIAPLLGVTARPRGEGWTLEPPSNAIGR
jgi:transmembrane sensor